MRLSRGSNRLGIAAIENTIAGSLLPNHELLRRSRMQIIGEEKIRISHMLCALPGQRLEDIEEVRSHPIALMQCGDFLKTMPHARIVVQHSTGAPGLISSSPVDRPTCSGRSTADNRSYASCASWRSGPA